MNKIQQLQKSRIEAMAKADAAEARMRAAGASADAIALATKDCDDALASVEDLDLQIKAEQTRLSEEVTANANRSERLSRLHASNGPRTLSRSQSGNSGITGQRERSEEDPSRGFKNPRDFFHAVMQVGLGAQMDTRLGGLQAVAGADEQNGMNNGFGGFLIPAGMAPNLLSVAGEADPTAGLTTRVPMTSPTIHINARTDKDHTTSVTGGLRFYRRKESGTVNASKMEMEQIKLSVNSLMGVNFQTEELLADSPISVASLIENGFREELGSHMFNEKLRGTGVGEYLGILNSDNPALITVAAEGGQAADTIVGANIVKMRSRCWGYGKAVWLANIDTYPQLIKAHVTGTNGDIFLFVPASTIGGVDTLNGRPIYFSEFSETLGDKGDLILADFSQYLEGAIGSMESMESTHVRFLENERAFRVSMRNDGRPWWRSAITPKKGAATLSPFVTLAAR